MINLSFNFLIEQYQINFSKEFEKYIDEYPLEKYEINNNSFFKEKDNKLLFQVHSYLNTIFTKNKCSLENVWIQKYNKNQFHDLHTHGPENFSFVWYINCTENSSKTHFFNPGYPYFMSHELSVAPEKGKLIFFDGSIPHYVFPNKDNTRTIVSGNCKKWQK